MSFGKHCLSPGLFAQLLPQDSLQLSTCLEWQAPSDGLGKGSTTPGMVVWSLFTPFFRSKRKGDAVCMCVHVCLCEVLAVSVFGGKGSVSKTKVYCFSCHHETVSPLVFKRPLGSIFKRCFPLKMCLRDKIWNCYPSCNIYMTLLPGSLLWHPPILSPFIILAIYGIVAPPVKYPF